MIHFILVRLHHSGKLKSDVDPVKAAQKIRGLAGVSNVYLIDKHTSGGLEVDPSTVPQGDIWDLVVASSSEKSARNLEQRILDEILCDWTAGFSTNLT